MTRKTSGFTIVFDSSREGIPQLSIINCQLSIILFLHYKQGIRESIKKPPPFPAEVKKPVKGSIT